jgi:hypothetical protein
MVAYKTPDALRVVKMTYRPHIARLYQREREWNRAPQSGREIMYWHFGSRS